MTSETDTNITFKSTTIAEFVTMMMMMMMMIVRRSDNRTVTAYNDIDVSSELNRTRHHFDSMIQQLRDDVTQLLAQVRHNSISPGVPTA